MAPQTRKRLWHLAFAPLLLVATACSSPTQPVESSASAAEPAPFTLRVGFIGTTGRGALGPEGWGAQKGILGPALQKAGVGDIQWFGFPNGPDLNEALAAGELDIGIYGDTPAIVARAAGLKTRLIAQSTVGMNAWILTREDGPLSLSELKGKTVGVQKGSYIHRYLAGLLAEQGLSRDVTIVHLLSTEGEAALLRGDLDAYAFASGLGPELALKGYRVLDEAAEHPHLLGSSLTVITEEALKRHPDLPEAWLEARRLAIEDLTGAPEEFYQYLAEASGYSLDAVRASYPLEGYPTDPFTDGGLALLEGTKAFLVNEGLAKSDFALEDWIWTPARP